jgi:hypothetical protein
MSDVRLNRHIVLLTNEKTGHTDDGSMRPQDREKALSDIQKRPEVRVILISTKAGNSGTWPGCQAKNNS